MFKLGFSTIGCPDYTVDQVVALAKDNGYAGIEIRFLRGTVDLLSLPELSPQGLPDTRRRFADAGIDVVSIGTSVRMNSLDLKRATRRANWRKPTWRSPKASERNTSGSSAVRFRPIRIARRRSMPSPAGLARSPT